VGKASVGGTKTVNAAGATTVSASTVAKAQAGPASKAGDRGRKSVNAAGATTVSNKKNKK
jgi:hypothetical protein